MWSQVISARETKTVRHVGLNLVTLNQKEHDIADHCNPKDKNEPSDRSFGSVGRIVRARDKFLLLGQSPTDDVQHGRKGKGNDKPSRAGIIRNGSQLSHQYGQDNGRDTGE